MSHYRHGAEVNGKDKYGETPLMLASRLGYPDIVQLLLEHGADPNARNLENQTALDLAVANRHPPHFSNGVLKRYNRDRGQPFTWTYTGKVLLA